MAISKGAMSGDLEIRDFKTKKGKTCDELFCVLHKGTLLGFSDSFMLSSPVLAVPITTDTQLAGPAANTIAIDGSASTSKDLAKYYGRVAKVQASVVLVAETGRIFWSVENFLFWWTASFGVWCRGGVGAAALVHNGKGS